MARLQLGGVEYELLNFTDEAEWVVRDDDGDVHVIGEVYSADAKVEVQCERCGMWTGNAVPMDSGRWVCADRSCYDEEGAA